MKISKNLLVCALLVLVMLCVVSTASATDAADLNLTASDTEGGGNCRTNQYFRQFLFGTRV